MSTSASSPAGIDHLLLIIEIALGLAIFFQFRELIALGWNCLVQAWHHPNRWRPKPGRGHRRW